MQKFLNTVLNGNTISYVRLCYTVRILVTELLKLLSLKWSLKNVYNYTALGFFDKGERNSSQEHITNKVYKTFMIKLNSWVQSH